MLQYRLEVEVQRPALSIRSQPAQIRLESRRPMFRQSTRPPQMQISRVKPSFTVDRSQTSWAVNQSSVFQLARQFRRESVQKGLEAIGRIASEGDRLRMIHLKHNTMARIISERLTDVKNLNLVAVPKPQINWEPGQMEIEWTPFEQELIWDMPGMLEIDVVPHQVIIELEQLPDISFRFVYLNELT